MSDKSNEGGKRKYARKTRDQKEAELLAALAKIQAEKAVERMGDHPVMQRIVSIRETLTARATSDRNLIEGYGRGLPGVERIRKLRAELADLETRMERAAAFVPGVDAMFAGLDDLQAAVLAGEYDNDEKPDFSFLTDEYKSWTETELERIARLEKEARAEQRANAGKASEADETPETVADADNAEPHPVTDDVPPAPKELPSPVV